jgi:hypothetical protein
MPLSGRTARLTVTPPTVPWPDELAVLQHQRGLPVAASPGVGGPVLVGGQDAGDTLRPVGRGGPASPSTRCPLGPVDAPGTGLAVRASPCLQRRPPDNASGAGAPRSKHRQPLVGKCYLHTVIDDHSRVAYVEAHDDETKETATEVLRNAVAWFAERGVSVRRVMTDNGGCYKSHLWRETCAELGITHKRTRPYRPQTNGKIERFHRTLVEGWAFKKFYSSESARLAALPAWIHDYNHHRPHSAIGKAAPITRLNNLAGHHT